MLSYQEDKDLMMLYWDWRQGLSEQGYELVSTGGSAAALEKASLPVQRVEQLTGFPEMLDGTT